MFAMLKVLGKYIDGSGLDKVFTEAGVYGETTLDGKHMKRAVEAHLMYLALSRFYFRDWFSQNEECFHNLDDLREELKYLSSLSYERRNAIKISSERLSQLLETSELFEKFEEFEKSLKQQGRHLRNYMSMCECLLLFIRSSRQGIWNLHLSSLNCFVKYFFAHDQINYTRLTPLYLADMLQLKGSDRKTWDYLNKKFSVSKSISRLQLSAQIMLQKPESCRWRYWINTEY